MNEISEEQDQNNVVVMPDKDIVPAYKRYAGTSDDDEVIPPLWLITFTDIMALMLTFFVLLYSMVMPVEEKWAEMTAAINNNFSQDYAPQFNEGTQVSVVIDKISNSRALDLRYLESIVRKTLSDNRLTSEVLIFPQKDRLVVSMPDDLFFESGSADVGAQGKKILFELGGALQRIKNAIEIVGHADPRPVGSNNSEFKDNWDLSLARAMSVSAVFENVGYTKPHIIRAMSSARYDDLPEELNEEKKLALSRRVDIVILEDDAPTKSFFGMKL